MEKSMAGSKQGIVRRGYPVFLLLLLMYGYSPSLHAADKAWIEIRSPHFRVLSDAPEKEVRQVAREFEQIRAVLARMMSGSRLESGTPFLIVAPNDEFSTRTLLPQCWKQSKPAGFFVEGWEKEFALVRLDIVRREGFSQVPSAAFEVVYHEYTHSVMNANFRWMPLWLSEGVAEFYGNTRFTPAKVFVGAPNPDAKYVNRPLFSIEKLIGMTPSSKEYRDDATTFYFESWALVHFLSISPQMEQGKKLHTFLTLLEKGVDQKKAFKEAIGDMRDIDVPLNLYLQQNLLNNLTLPNPPDIKPESFAVRKLTAAESGAELGVFQLWVGDIAAARPKGASGIRLAEFISAPHFQSPKRSACLAG